MLSTTPRLRIRRPSPTTSEFTVTTSPPPTLPLRLLHLLLLLLRVALSVATLLLLQARWAQSPLFLGGLSTATDNPTVTIPPSPPPPPRPQVFLSEAYLWWLLDAFHRSPAGQAFSLAAAQLPPWLLLPLAAVVFYAVSLRPHREESLLVLRGLGVQTSESGRTFLSGAWGAGARTRFIPTDKIQDVLVNEAFTRGFEVRYYLVVVVEDEEDVVVVFPGLLPRRKIVETVWRGVRECLYEGRAEDKS